MHIINLLFVVPTALGILVFWSIWRLVRLLDLSLSARRTLFVLLGTLTLAPMLIPIATIMTAWVPHGMLILTMPNELFGYYIQVARYVFPSFVVTALLFGLIAMRWVKADTMRLQPNWATFLVPFFVVLLIVATYRYAFPSNEIPQHVNRDSIEAVYGQRLNEVTALLYIDDTVEQDSAIKRLSALFDSDTSVLAVNLQDPDKPGGRTFHYLRGKSKGNSFCSGVVPPEQAGLLRCTWTATYQRNGLFFPRCAKRWLGIFRTCEEREVLHYARRFTFGEETIAVTIDLDYEEALRAVDR